MPDKKPTIKEEHATVYTLRNIPHGGWADITIREWEGGGSFGCQSDYGNFAYQWGAIGERNLRQFLCGLDKQYFMKKTRTEDHMLFSGELSASAVRSDILRARRDGSISSEDARVAWDQLDSSAEDSRTPDEFAHVVTDGYCGEDSVVDLVYGGDIYGVPFREESNPMCDLFWERVWPHITKYWKENA